MKNTHIQFEPLPTTKQLQRVIRDRVGDFNGPKKTVRGCSRWTRVSLAALAFSGLASGRCLAAGLPFGEGIVVVRSGRLFAVPLATGVAEVGLTNPNSGDPDFLGGPANPSYAGHGFIYFDAQPAGDHRRPHRLGLFQLGTFTKLTSDPFGNSIDRKPVANGLLDKPYLLYTTNRNGTFRTVVAPMQSQGPGFGFSVPGGSSAYAWSRSQGTPPVAFLIGGTTVSEVEFPDSNPYSPVLRNSIALVGDSVGTISRLDTAPGEVLLVSATGGIYLGHAGDAQLVRLRSTGRDAVFHPHDPSRIAFAEAPDGEDDYDYEIFTARLTADGTGLGEVTRITSNDDDDLQPAWFVMPSQASMRIQGSGSGLRVSWPQWIVDYELQTTPSLSPPDWLPWSESIGAGIYENFIFVANPSAQNAGFFRLRVP